MKVKNVTVRIKSLEDVLEEAKDVMKRLEKGEKVKKHEGISFDNLDVMRKVLTEERLRILKTVKKEHPASIYQLAKMLGRDRKNTFDDVQYLAEVGFVELKKTKKEGRERATPSVKYDKILLEIPV